MPPLYPGLLALGALEEGHQRSEHHTDGNGQRQDVLDDDATGVSPGHEGSHKLRDHDEDDQTDGYGNQSFYHITSPDPFALDALLRPLLFLIAHNRGQILWLLVLALLEG